MKRSCLGDQAGTNTIEKGEPHRKVASNVSNASTSSTGTWITSGSSVNIDAEILAGWPPFDNFWKLNFNFRSEVERMKKLGITVIWF